MSNSKREKKYASAPESPPVENEINNCVIHFRVLIKIELIRKRKN